MTTARLFVVEWESTAGLNGGAYPIMVDPLSTPDDIREDAQIALEEGGWAGQGEVKSITEYVPVSTAPKEVKVYRTNAEYVSGTYTYHLEIVGTEGDMAGKGTGKWIVIRSATPLEIAANRPMFIELPEGLS